MLSSSKVLLTIIIRRVSLPLLGGRLEGVLKWFYETPPYSSPKRGGYDHRSNNLEMILICFLPEKGRKNLATIIKF